MALTRITKGVIKPNENYDTHNINSTGIITATKFVGPVTGAITGTAALASGLTGTPSITVQDVVAVGATFTGNVSIGGTLTYEDVTNIDSVGLVTARTGLVSPYADIDDWIDVGNNIQLGNAGVITATTFRGDGDFVELDVDGHTNLDNVSVAGVTTHNEDVTFTGVTAGRNAFWDKSENSLEFGDYTYAKFGVDEDLSIFSQNTLSVINNKTGELRIPSAGNVRILKRHDGSGAFAGELANFKVDGAVDLFYAGNKKFETTNTGAVVTGILTATSFSGAVTGTASGNAVLTGTTNNQVVTVTGANAIQGESALTFDGNTLKIIGTQNSYLNNNILSFDRAGYSYIDQLNDNGSLVFRVTSGYTNALRLDPNAQAIFGGNLIIPDAIQHVGDLDCKIRFPGTDTISFETASNERLRIHSTGKVVIGTGNRNAETSTGALLIDRDITAESDAGDPTKYHLVIRSQTNSNSSKLGIGFQNTTDDDKIGAAILHHRTAGGSVGDLAFYTSGSDGTITERLKINRTGHVTIGEANFTASNDVHIKRANAGGDVALRVTNNTNQNSGSTASLYLTTSPTQDFNTAAIQAVRDGGLLNFSYGTAAPTVTMKVSSGQVGIGTENPDYLLTVAGISGTTKLNLKRTNASANGNAYGSIFYTTETGADVASIRAHRESSNTNAYLAFSTKTTSGNIDERLRIDSSGNVIVSGASIGDNGSFGIQPSGHVRTVLANGSGAGDTLFGAVGGVSNGFQINVDSSNNQNYYFHNGSSRTISIRSTGKTEFGATGGNYGSDPKVVNIGSRAANIQGTLAIARGEGLGGGTGPLMEFVHGPDGGTQRVHSIYSYIGDLRVFADTNENLELRGTETIFKDNANTIRMRVKSDLVVTENNVGLEVWGGTGNHTNDTVILSQKSNNNDWCYKAQASDGSSTDYGMYIRCAAGGSYVYSAYDTTNSQWIFRVGGNGTIYAINTSITSISDRRLKENIVDANSQWDDIKALRFRNFTWKNSTDTAPKLGLISDEVEAVAPNLVELNPQSKEDIENNVPDPEYKNVKYSIVWMKAVKALQEAQARIETLEAKVAALEGS